MTFNVTDGIRNAARLHPTSPAVLCGMPGVDARSIDYATLDRILDAIGARLIGEGLAPGASVDIPTRDALALLLIKLASGRLGISSFQGVRGHGVDLMLVQAGHAFPTAARAIAFDPSWWSADAVARAPADALPQVGGGAIFAVLRTSGSTGRPKEVLVTHDMMRARWFGDFADGMPGRARLLCPSGPGGGIGMGAALRAFRNAGTVIVAGENDDLGALVGAHRVNAFIGSPYSVSRLVSGRTDDAGPFASLEVAMISGARMPAALARTVRARACANLWCMYGATEVGPVAFGSLAALRDRPGAAGFVLPGVTFEALDETGRPLPPGEQGLLRIRSAGMGHEYLDDAQATARHFRDGWFVPGDVGTVYADRALVIDGRNDDLINLGGSKFAPELFENALLSVPGVVEAAAFPLHHANGSTGLGAAIVANDGVGVQALEASFHRSQLPVPVIVLRIPRLPRTDTGKLRRADLAAMAMARMPVVGRETP